MSNCEEQVKKYIEKNRLIEGDEIVLAGVSGGADSVCLFYLLNALSKEMNFRLCVVHINHMIRDVADSEARYVESICKEEGVTFFRRDIDIPQMSRTLSGSEEEIGRNARYNAFEEIASQLEKENGKKVVIATAHNRNDQAETMLHNLFRGSRLKGLAGIKPRRKRGNHYLIRPILLLERYQIEEYLTEKGYKWCNDESNQTDDYTRNRIRHNILPVAAEQINAGALRHVAETAEYLAEVDEYLDMQAELAEREIIRSDNEKMIYSCEGLKNVPHLVRNRIFMRGICRVCPHIKDVTASHLEDLEHLIESSSGSASLDLPYGVRAQRAYDELYFFSKDNENNIQKDEIPVDITALEDGQTVKITCPGTGNISMKLFPYNSEDKIPDGQYTKWFDYDKIDNGMLFRKRRVGDTICIGEGRKTLKKFMIDEKIPSDVRDKIFVLADGDMILWVPGYRIGSNYKVTEDTRRILEVKI